MDHEKGKRGLPLQHRISVLCAGSIAAICICVCTGCGAFRNGESERMDGSAGSSTDERASIDLMQGIKPDDLEQPDEGRTEKQPDMETFYTDTTDFAIELLKANGRGESSNVENENRENVMVSPVSVLSVLSMTANGAGGATREQMFSVLAPDQDMDALNVGWKTWADSLTNTKEAALELSNAVWLCDREEKFIVKEEFLHKNARYYEADIYKAPFGENTLQEINAWASKKTDGKVRELLNEIQEDAVMYLVNTAVFDAEWKWTYQFYQVKESTFTNAGQQEEDVFFLHSTESIFLEDDHATGFVKPYKEGYRFVALLPEKEMSPEEYLEMLDGEQFRTLLAEAKNDVIVEAGMPKFEAEYEVELSTILPSMGMPDAFDRKKADFHGIGTAPDKNIYISKVIHKTSISVGELGTKALAATAGDVAAEAAEDDPEIQIYRVYLKSPFLYAIVEEKTNIPVFLGILNKVN